MRMTSDLLFYKLDSEVKDPFRATEGSACFDLHSFLPENSVAKVFISHSEGHRDKRKKSSKRKSTNQPYRTNVSSYWINI